MSLYAIHSIARRVAADPDFQASMQEAPELAIADYDLTDAERSALLTGDISTLLDWGAHGYLLSKLALAGVCQLSPPIYAERSHR
jgi:Aromatic-ring-opening dioxygenase LigAB, LigA subunit